MGIFKKVGQAIKSGLKAVPVVGSVVSVADAAYSAIKKNSGKSSSKKSTTNAKLKSSGEKAKRWVSWAPNWVIIVSGVGVLGLVIWMMTKKKRRRR